jgi:hypothetical protein
VTTAINVADEISRGISEVDEKKSQHTLSLLQVAEKEAQSGWARHGGRAGGVATEKTMDA